jgi:hypothetical protein
MLVVAAFFGGIHFELERRRREDERRYELEVAAGQSDFVVIEGAPTPNELCVIRANPNTVDRLSRVLMEPERNQE